MYDYNCPDCNEAKLQSDKNVRKINEIINQVNTLIQVNNETVNFIEENANRVISEVAKREVNEVLGDLNTKIDNNTNELDNKIRILSNNQIPREYIEQQIDTYIGTNNSNLATKSSINKDIAVLDSKLFVGTEYNFNLGNYSNSNTISKDWILTNNGCESKVGYNLYKVTVPQKAILKVVGAEMYQIQTSSRVPSLDSENSTIIEKGSCLSISYHKLEARQWLIVSGQNCKVYEVHNVNDLTSIKSDIFNNFINGEDYVVDSFVECGLRDEDGTSYWRLDTATRYSSDFLPLTIPFLVENNTSFPIIIYKYDKLGFYKGLQRIEKSQTFDSLDEEECFIRILVIGEKDGSIILKHINKTPVNYNYDTNKNLRQTIYNSIVSDDNKVALSNNLKIHNDKAYDLKIMSINTQKWASDSFMYKSILKNNNCDIIGVQEHDLTFADKTNVIEYVKTLGNEYNFEIAPDKRFPVGKLLSTKCVLNKYNHIEFNTQLGEKRAYQKGYIKVNGKEICVINAHLATSNDESAKIAQSMELLEICKKEKYFILMADFNYVTTESQNEYELIAKPFIDQGYNLGNWKDKNYIMTWSDSTDRNGVWQPTDNIITSSNIDIVVSFVDETKLNDDIIEAVDHLPFIAYLNIH